MYNVLTSRSIQKRYIHAATTIKNRRNVKIIQELWLADMPENKNQLKKIEFIKLPKDLLDLRNEEILEERSKSLQAKLKYSTTFLEHQGKCSKQEDTHSEFSAQKIRKEMIRNDKEGNENETKKNSHIHKIPPFFLFPFPI